MTALTTLYNWFSDLKKPTGAQFRALIDSFWHKGEKIPMAGIEGLSTLIEGTASASQLKNHLEDSQAHKELLDKKVDKVPGKKLSTEDFTTELRRKLEALEQVDISGLLPRGGYTGTAQDLKNLIDAINRILQSDDTDLDQLQEIVTYIKQNKHILSTLGINNIAGLVEALAAKADKDHHHDERYAPKEHHHNQYAYRTHRHNWDDFEGKPRLDFLPLGGGVITPVDSGDHQEGIRIGRADNGWAMITLGTQGLSGVKEGEYALARDANGNFLLRTAIGGVMKDLIIANKNEVILSDIIKVPTLVLTSGDSPKDIVKIRTADKTLIIGNEEFNEVYYYRGAGFRKDGSSDNKILLGGGGDIEISELLARKGGVVSNSFPLRPDHRNMVLFVTNSVTLELGGLESLGGISFRKVFDGGEVIFTCEEKSITYTGDTQFNGKRGSTAVVSVYNNECYIDIRNV